MYKPLDDTAYNLHINFMPGTTISIGTAVLKHFKSYWAVAYTLDSLDHSQHSANHLDVHSLYTDQCRSLVAVVGCACLGLVALTCMSQHTC